MTKEIKDVLKLVKNEYTTYLNIWDTMKAVQRSKFIALSAYINKTKQNKKIEKQENKRETIKRSHISNVTAYLKALEEITLKGVRL